MRGGAENEWCRRGGRDFWQNRLANVKFGRMLRRSGVTLRRAERLLHRRPNASVSSAIRGSMVAVRIHGSRFLGGG